MLNFAVITFLPVLESTLLFKQKSFKRRLGEYSCKRRSEICINKAKYRITCQTRHTEIPSIKNRGNLCTLVPTDFQPQRKMKLKFYFRFSLQ